VSGPLTGMTERLAPDSAGIARAAELLASGQLVAFPTETVYGLGADATSGEAVARIYTAKGRPRFNPLIAHVASLAAARSEGVFNDTALMLGERFWPGPLTLVVPAAPGSRVSDLARAGLDTVALRVPGHPIALDLLRRAGCPIAAPSANRSGRVSPTTATHVLADLGGRIDAVLDGGPTQVGLESTIVTCLTDSPRLLRPGGLPREAIEEAIGRALAGGSAYDGAPRAPGMLASHYSPRARVRLNAERIAPGEAALLFGRRTPADLSGAGLVLNLSDRGDLAEAAAHLFSHLRALDDSGAATIAVAPIPEQGLGEAVNDCLRRAAAEPEREGAITP
jgi:L-threonylcarbamoyladenylate synthase